MKLAKFAGPPLVIALALLASEAAAAEALHAVIDRLVEAQAGEDELRPRSGDAEFVRRVHLDLVGRIPTAEETRAFLADGSADKREKLIDRLLASPEWPRRMQELFHVMLMERRNDDPEWETFLRASFEANKSWEEIARAILRPDAGDEKMRGAAFFHTARLVSEGAMAPVDVPGLTRDVGRMFAGVDLQCAQCHDHLYIEDYKQQDFQGLHAIFENVKKERGDFPAIAEKLMAQEQEYMSVFEQVPKKTGLVIPGAGEVEIVKYEEGEEWAVPPDRKKRTAGVPKFSPLGELATRLAAPDNDRFARNIANRMWFVMMGKGLVEPLDLHHSSNPATHPELLDALAREFAAHGFDFKWLLKELALSEAYQRTSVVEAEKPEPLPESYAAAIQKRVSAEQLFWSVLVATGELDHARKKLAEQPEKKETAEEKGEGEEEAREPEKKNPAEMTAEEVVAEVEELGELRERFLDTFANPPKEPELDFEPTVKAALFLLNDARMLKYLKRRPGNLIDRVAALEGADAVADELYLSVLSRPPSEEDRADAAAFLERFEERREEAISHLAWALLASTEFCVNH